MLQTMDRGARKNLMHEGSKARTVDKEIALEPGYVAVKSSRRTSGAMTHNSKEERIVQALWFCC